MDQALQDKFTKALRKAMCAIVPGDVAFRYLPIREATLPTSAERVFHLDYELKSGNEYINVLAFERELKSLEEVNEVRVIEFRGINLLADGSRGGNSERQHLCIEARVAVDGRPCTLFLRYFFAAVTET